MHCIPSAALGDNTEKERRNTEIRGQQCRIPFFERKLLNPGLLRMTSRCLAYQTQFRLKEAHVSVAGPTGTKTKKNVRKSKKFRLHGVRCLPALDMAGVI